MKGVYPGRFIPRQSLIHNLHPLLKFIFFILTISSVVKVDNNSDILFLYGLLLFLIILSHIKLIEILTLLKPFLILLLFTFCLQLFYNSNGEKSFYNAIFITNKFVLMIVYSSLLTLTTNPLDLMKVVNLFIKPLKAFKVDTNALAIAGIISIRFIPLIFDEVEKIKIAHKFRKHFKKSFLVKIDFVSNMLVPLFIKVSHYSEQLTINLVQRDNWDQILKISKPAFKDQVIFCLLLVLITGIKFV